MLNCKFSAKSLVAVLGIIGYAQVATASNGDRIPLAITIGAGQASLTGDLTDGSQGQASGTAVMMFPQHNPGTVSTWGVRGYYLVDFADINAKTSQTTEFPFEKNQSIKLQETAVVPVLCMFADAAVSPCFGVGFAKINAQTENNEQTYGSFRGDLRLGRYFQDGLIGGVEYHAVAVKQRISGRDSSFLAQHFKLAIGWRW